MKIHFLNTGETFPYSYYIGVKTALKIYGKDVTLWCLETPVGQYFEKLTGIVNIKKIEATKQFPILAGKDDHFQKVCLLEILI